MIAISEIELFKILREKIGEEQVQAITQYVEAKVEKNMVDSKNILATKEDLANNKVDIIKWVFGFFIVMILAIICLYFKH